MATKKTTQQKTTPIWIDNIGLKRAKSFSISAIMKDSRLAKLLKEAYNAPLGSTKRSQTAAMLKSLRRIKYNKDGRGGYAYYRYQDGQGGLADLQKLNVFSQPGTGQISSMPAPNITAPGMSIESLSVPAQAWENKNLSFTKNEPPILPSQQNKQLPTKLTVGATAENLLKESSKTIQSNLLSDIFKTGSTDYPQQQPIINLNYQPMYSVVPNNPMKIKNNQTGKLLDRFFADSNNKIIDTWDEYKNKTYSVLPPITPTGAVKPPLQPTTPLVQPVTKPYGPEEKPTDFKLPEKKLPEEKLPEEKTAPEIQNWYDEWYNSLTPDMQGRYSELYQSARAGMSPPEFALLMVSNKEKMEKMYPGVPLDALPTGASLAGQINDLEARIREGKGIDQLEAQMRQIKARGLTLVPTLKQYITGRDVYLNKVDQMLKDTQAKMIKMDTANPMIANMMNQYTNYLSVLKGRQNQRYVDFLNTSITEHNNESTLLQSQYEFSVSQYEREVQRGGALLTEDYQTRQKEYDKWVNVLEGAMENLTKQEENYYSNYILKEQAAQAYLQTTLDSAKVAASSGSTDYYKNKDRYMEIIAGINWEDVDYDKGQSLMTGQKTLEGIIDIIESDPDAKDPSAAFYWLREYVIPQDISNWTKSGKIGKVHGTYGKMLGNYAASGRPNAYNDASKLAAAVPELMANSFYDYLTGSEQAITKVKEALKDLVDKSWTGKPNYGAKDKSKFIENYKDKGITTDILSELFDNYVTNIIQTGKDPRKLYDFELSNEDLANDIVRNLKTQWKGLYVSENGLKTLKELYGTTE